MADAALFAPTQWREDRGAVLLAARCLMIRPNDEEPHLGPLTSLPK